MPTLPTLLAISDKTLARWLRIATFLMPIIALVAMLSPRTPETPIAASAAPVVLAQEAEKKVTIEGVDSTRIGYDLDDDSPENGVFKSDPGDDDRDVAASSKIKSVRVLRQDGTVFPNGTRDCASQNCTVVVNTNRGAITIKDLPTNSVELTYGMRQSYRYSCRRKSVHSRRVNVQSVRLSGPDLTINCPSNKCSAEITYTVRGTQQPR